MKKRAFAILLSAALLVSLLPVNALAENEEPVETETNIEEETEPETEAETPAVDPALETELTGDQTENKSETATEGTADAAEKLAEETEPVAEEPEEETDPDYDIMPLAVSGVAGISSFTVTAQVDGTAPWDSDDTAGNDSSASNNIVRTFDYVNYTLTYITALSDDTVPVNSGTIFVEFTLPCGPEIASFNMNTLNWMNDPEVTYYLSDGTTTKEYQNGDPVTKQVLTGDRELINTDSNTAIPGTGTLSVGVYIGAATNGTTLKPEFTAWMDDNSDEDKVSVTNQETLAISAAQKYNIGIRQASEMNISGTYDLSTGNENAAKDTISGNTSLRGRMEGYGITVMMQNDSVDKGLKGLEFPSGNITFDITLSEQAENRSGNDLSSTAGYTPVIWDYDANLRKTAAQGGSVGQWNRTWVYTNANNRDCAYGAAPYNKLGCTTYSTIYDSCYDGGSWYMVQDSTNPLVYHVTIKDYTIDYKDYNFPTANNTWYARTEAGTVYTANQACLSAGTTQMVLQFPEDAVNAPTHIYYKMVADNFAVDGAPYDVTATYTNTYELVPEGSIQCGTNFTDDMATSRAASGHQLGSGYMAGDAYSFIGTNIRLWGYQSTTTDEYVRTKATLIKFDADAFEVNRDDQYYESGRYMHGSGTGAVNSFTRYFAGRSSNWESDQVMSDTLINSTDLHYYTSLDDLQNAGYTCVGVLYIADVNDINTSSQSQGMIGLTVKDESALIGNVYAACNDSWASYSTLDELAEEYGSPITSDGTINADWARNGYNLYKAYCSLSVYETMKTTIESGNRGDYWYHKTEYDADGNITGGHDVGYYGGTSLLICGEKSTVEISTDKAIYDMDSGQRTAVVTVTPSVTVEGNASSETGDKETTTTTATVKVTLPSDLTYDEGTAYWGDTAITPEVTVNDDGTTVLTFTLENVTLNETLDDLTFNCTIGHAGTAEDVTNNQSIELNATIESTNDHRAKEESFGNSSNTSFNVIRLSATSISKSVDNRMIERNGSFTWTLNYYNGADEDIKGTEMVDVFPVSGDALGSSFVGTYSITKIEIDFTNAPNSYTADNSSMHFYVSTDYSGTGSDLASGGTPSGSDWTDLMEEYSSASDFVITLDTSYYKNMKAFYCDLGNLDTQETVVVRISVQTDGNDPADIYNNLYYEAATGQDAAVQSNLVTTQVVKRDISGRTWIDDSNGIQDEGEAAFEDITVTLYTESGGSEEQAVDVYGNQVKTVKTSLDGFYKFDNLPAGTYRIEFSDVNGYMYSLTKKDIGDDDTVDSDAAFVSNDNGELIADIEGVSLPEIDDMDRYLYESEYHDAGYYEIVDISGTKIWDDAEDQDGLRPESIIIHLLADGEPALDESGQEMTATVTSENGWTWSFTDLLKYEDGEEIVYTVTEDAIEGYDTEILDLTLDEETGIYSVTVTNTHEPETVDISGSKTWDDENNQDGKRPSAITIRLLADGTEVASETVNATDDWTWTFTDLPKYRDQGTEIVYTITEDSISDYTSTVDGYNVTNTHIPETIDIKGSKIWDDADNQDGDRPESITIHLHANGKADDVASKTVTAADNWEWSFTDLPKYENGVEIRYTITEDSISDYTSTVNGYDVTNKHTPGKVGLNVVKYWNDDNDRDGERPTEVTVELTKNGEKTGNKITLSAQDDWSGGWTDLDEYTEGVKNEYSVAEDSVLDYGFVARVEVIDGTTTVFLTNEHVSTLIDITGSKTWDDADDQDGIRPNSITVYLYADGEPVLDENNEAVKQEVSTDNDWTWTFTDLPKYHDHGVEIVYTVEEAEIEGYESEISGYDITNIHTPETIDIPVNKIWEVDNDIYSYMPDSIDVALYANGEDTGETITLDESTGWAGTFTEMDKYEEGERILYTVKEISDETLKYYTPKITYEDDGSVTILNQREYFDIDEEIVPDEDDRDTWTKSESVNEYNAIELEMSTYLPVIEPDELGNGQFTMNFHEILDSELNLDEVEGDFSVAIAGYKIDPQYYTVEISPDDGCSFHVDVDLTALYEDGVITDDDLLGDTEIMIFFFADLEGTGLNGSYKSTVWYDIYDGDEWQYTSNEDVVEVYTYEIAIEKYDSNTNEKLEGATFGVYYDKTCDDPVMRSTNGEEATAYTAVSDEDGMAMFYGLAEGTYYVKELEAPDCYVLNDEALEIKLGEDLIDSDYTCEVPFANMPETRDISGSKTWEDNNNKADARPESITVNLYQNRELYESRTVTADDDWSWSWTDLLKYDENGEPYVYTINENTVENYDVTYYEGNFNITNTFVSVETDKESGNSGPEVGGDTGSGAKTGDTTPIGLWIALLCAGAVMAVMAYRLRKRTNK